MKGLSSFSSFIFFLSHTPKGGRDEVTRITQESKGENPPSVRTCRWGWWWAMETATLQEIIWLRLQCGAFPLANLSDSCNEKAHDLTGKDTGGTICHVWCGRGSLPFPTQPWPLPLVRVRWEWKGSREGQTEQEVKLCPTKRLEKRPFKPCPYTVHTLLITTKKRKGNRCVRFFYGSLGHDQTACHFFLSMFAFYNDYVFT